MAWVQSFADMQHITEHTLTVDEKGISNIITFNRATLAAKVA